MADVLKNYFSKFKEYLADETLITDLLSKVTITFGVILIIGGLYLMIINPITSTQATQLSQTAKSTVNTVSWIPGIPFNFDDLANFTSITVGSVSWILRSRYVTCWFRTLGKAPTCSFSGHNPVFFGGFISIYSISVFRSHRLTYVNCRSMHRWTFCLSSFFKV